MTPNHIQVHVSRNYGPHLSFMLFGTSGAQYVDGAKLLLPTLKWEEVDPQLEHQPSFHLSRENAQDMMDQLWSLGTRPTEQGSPGQIAALEGHLWDMRVIAFHKLGIMGEPKK